MGELVHLKQTKSTKAERVKITKSVIDGLAYDPHGSSWQAVFDTEIENLGVRVLKTSKSWILRYRNAEGKQRQWTIGPTSKITVPKARKLAAQGNARIVLGEDPSAEKQATRREPDEDTFSALAESYVEEYAKKKRKTWETDRGRLLADPADVKDDGAKAARLKAPIRKLHALRPGHDSREKFEDALREVHDAISKSSPVEADRVVQTVNACLNWHIKRRNVSAAFTNIAELVELNGHASRDAYIRPAELAGFAKAVQARPLKWKAAFWLMLLTGSRSKSEVLSLRWENVHLHAGEFTYPETKNGTAHTLPMTPATRAIFEAPANKSEWLFPGRKKGPLQDSRKQLAKVRKATKFVDRITPHALRHTARTYLQTKLRVPGPTVDAVLNHSTHGMAGTYTHVHLDDVKAALEELEAFVLREAKIDDFAEYLAKKPTKGGK